MPDLLPRLLAIKAPLPTPAYPPFPSWNYVQLRADLLPFETMDGTVHALCCSGVLWVSREAWDAMKEEETL